jgi:hypothetical protein
VLRQVARKADSSSRALSRLHSRIVRIEPGLAHALRQLRAPSHHAMDFGQASTSRAQPERLAESRTALRGW